VWVAGSYVPMKERPSYGPAAMRPRMVTPISLSLRSSHASRCASIRPSSVSNQTSSPGAVNTARGGALVMPSSKTDMAKVLCLLRPDGGAADQGFPAAAAVGSRDDRRRSRLVICGWQTQCWPPTKSGCERRRWSRALPWYNGTLAAMAPAGHACTFIVSCRHAISAGHCQAAWWFGLKRENAPADREGPGRSLSGNPGRR
jgi:hypothetical protein